LNLNNNMGAGPDNIWPRLLKEMSSVIIQPFLYIVNLSLSTGIVPDKLKLAKVIPVYKKGDHLFLKITVLSHFTSVHIS